MSTLSQIQYVTGPNVTINLGGVPDGFLAISEVINNSLTRYQQFMFGLKLRTNQNRLNTKDGTITFGLLRSTDGGQTYDTNLRSGNILAVFSQLEVNTDYVFSISTAPLGFPPSHFKIGVRNSTGAPFFRREENFGLWYTGMRTLSTDTTASMAMNMAGDWLRS